MNPLENPNHPIASNVPVNPGDSVPSRSNPSISPTAPKGICPTSTLACESLPAKTDPKPTPTPNVAKGSPDKESDNPNTALA